MDILRHGECEGGEIFRGTTDVSTTAKGFDNMAASCDKAQMQQDAPWDVIVSSPLKRCRQFAEKYTAERSIQLSIEPLIAEMSFGNWEGKKIKWVWENYPSEMAAWTESPGEFMPPNGESVMSLHDRAQSVFDILLERYRSKRILLVTHGGFIRVFMAHLLDMPLSSLNRFDVPYASMSRFSIFHSEQDGEQKNIIKLRSHNAFPCAE